MNKTREPRITKGQLTRRKAQEPNNSPERKDIKARKDDIFATESHNCSTYKAKERNYVHYFNNAFHATINAAKLVLPYELQYTHCYNLNHYL